MNYLKILSPSSLLYYIVLLLLFISKCQSTIDPYQCFKDFYAATGRILSEQNMYEVCTSLTEHVICDDSYNILKLKINQIPASPQFTGSNIMCFQYLNEIEFDGFDLSTDFLTSSSYYVQTNFKVIITNPISISFGYIAPSITSLSVYTTNSLIFPSSLSLDFFKDLQELNLVDTTNSGQQIVSFTPQLVASSTLKTYNIFSLVLPNVVNINLQDVKIELQNLFTWDSYSSYSSVSNLIDISSPDLNTCIDSILLINQVPMQVKELNINLCLLFSSDYQLDFKVAYPLLERLNIESKADSFESLKFPFSTVPDSLEEFTLKGSTFGSLEYAYDVLRYVKKVNLIQNQITINTLPEYTLSPGVNTLLDLSFNGLSGTVPESYCKAEDLNLSYNSLSGNIPECFHCYYSINKFINNQFTNYGDMGNCDNKIMPTLRVDAGSKKIYLEGKNLGFSNQITTTPPLVWFMQVPSSFFIADYSQYMGSLDQTFQLLFQVPNKQFTVRTIKTKATINKVITNSNGLVQFVGSDFIYDYSKMSITINDYVCEIQSSNYTNVECQIDLNSSPYLTTRMKTYVTIMDGLVNHTRQTTIDFVNQGPYENNIIPCVGDCYGYGTCYSEGSCICYPNLQLINQNTCALNCGSFGTFNTSTAKCDCISTYQGQYCNQPVGGGSCPIINSMECNGGTCDSSTGICTCPKGREGIDCTGYSCPNNCTSLANGNCDTSTGDCECLSNYIGDDCSIKRCPNDCSNAGTCLGGVCMCNKGRTLHDCSGYSCLNDCTSLDNGNCNFTIGKCECLSNYSGDDCGIKKCPNDCSNAGVCVDGSCQCNNGRTFSDCSGYSCMQPCLNGASCNYTVGQCICKSNWKDETCSTPIHYISSVEPCSISGGQVIVYGWFSTIHTGLKVTIGDLECIGPVATESTITCTLGGGSGTKNVNVTQNGSSFIGKNSFQYYDPIVKCINNCTDESKGICDKSGQCICKENWSGFDCSSPKLISSPQEEIPPKPITKIDTLTAAATISSRDVNFEISIVSLVEFDISGNQVKTNLLQKKWDTEIKDSIYQFTQTIDNDDGSNDNQGSITYTIEEVNKTKNYEYAGLQLTIEEGGLKVSVNISNYQFINALNTLQLRFLSAAGKQEEEEEEETSASNNQCNQVESKTNTDNIDPNQTLNYITITKNNFKLSGRFINKLESDSRYTFMTSEVVKDLSNSSLIVIGLNLPHCISSCYIDPDFSVLVSSNYKSKCDSNDNSNKWVLPVAIVVPCVAVVAIVISSFFVYRKYRYQIRLFVHKKSNISLRNSFKLKRKSNIYGYK